MEPETNSQPLPPITQQPPIQPSKPEEYTSPKLLLFLILTLIGVSSYFGYQNWQLKQQISQNQPTPTSIVTSTSAPNPTATSPEMINNTDDNRWTEYTDSFLSFKHPKHWIKNGVTVTGIDPSIRIVIADNSSMMNECMEQMTIETKSGFVIRNFKSITTGEMCSGSNPTEAEIWIVNTKDSYGPGLQIRYSSADQRTTQILNNLISSFSFKN